MWKKKFVHKRHFPGAWSPIPTLSSCFVRQRQKWRTHFSDVLGFKLFGGICWRREHIFLGAIGLMTASDATTFKFQGVQMHPVAPLGGAYERIGVSLFHAWHRFKCELKTMYTNIAVCLPLLFASLSLWLGWRQHLLNKVVSIVDLLYVVK